MQNDSVLKNVQDSSELQSILYSCEGWCPRINEYTTCAHLCLQEYSPEERVMRLVKAVVAQRNIYVRDLVRGCIGSSDDAPVESPANFMIWEEVRRYLNPLPCVPQQNRTAVYSSERTQ